MSGPVFSPVFNDDTFRLRVESQSYREALDAACMRDYGMTWEELLVEDKLRQQMREYEQCSVACLFIFAIIATVSILNLSYAGGIASLIWVALAALFNRLKTKASWSRKTL